MSDLEFRSVTDAEWPEFLETLRMAFGALPAPGDEAIEKRPWAIERSMAALEDGHPVGCAGSYDFDLTLPGLTTAPAAGVTWVGVRPTHRRQGALTGIMRAQLEEIHDRGVPLAILLASESVLYGRYGYGMATTQVDLEIDRTRAVLAEPFEAPGRVVLVTDQPAIDRLLPEIHESVRRRQHGDVSRPAEWWKPFFAGGRGGTEFGPRFHAFYENPSGETEGYAYYRLASDFSVRLRQDWTVLLQGLGALTFEAYVALWRFVWDLDLTAKLVATFRPPDEPLRHLLRDPRRLATTRSVDFLWCRLVDVPAALSARRYEVTSSVVIEVRDPVCPWNAGRWRLDGSADGATCVRTDAAADLTMTATELGAVFLGGTHLSALAAARRIDEHATGAVARTDSMLSTARAPWCQTFF
ncbi:MAG TPA: GNAT family N-acetyltransferase [Acidimicrobiales bacterium]|nr:GNAT family N-acetyltransferase [Acidimicrobiales bacterium]